MDAKQIIRDAIDEHMNPSRADWMEALVEGISDALFVETPCGDGGSEI